MFLKTLQQLANLYRKRLECTVVSLTGSNGKTTTKELINKVLKDSFKVHVTPGNFNNHIGLPLTILSAPRDTEILILEMGDNKLGDIKELCEIAEPDLGFITNIGKDHIGGFGSFENNVKSKFELLDYLLLSNSLFLLDQFDLEFVEKLPSIKESFIKTDPISFDVNSSGFLILNHHRGIHLYPSLWRIQYSKCKICPCHCKTF